MGCINNIVQKSRRPHWRSLNLVRYLTWTIIFLLSAVHAAAQQDTFRIFLVGDAGEDAVTGTTLKNLGSQLLRYPNSAVIFLGDNSYKDALGGIIPFGFKGFDSSSLAQKKIRSQLSILDGYHGYVYFTPGNHDWWNKTRYTTGRPKLKMEQSFIEENLEKNATIKNPGNTFLPKEGRPGPDYVELNDHRIRVIFLDTYRLILPGFAKDQPDTALHENKFYDDLDTLLRDATLRRQRVVVIAHHPVYWTGPHQEKVKNDRLFSRIKASDINFPSYKAMSTRLRALLQHYPGIYYAAGHVHGLYYNFPADSIHYIISGAGSKIHRVSEKELKRYGPAGPGEVPMWNNKGFFEIDFMTGKENLFMYHNEGSQKLVLP